MPKKESGLALEINIPTANDFLALPGAVCGELKISDEHRDAAQTAFDNRDTNPRSWEDFLNLARVCYPEKNTLWLMHVALCIEELANSAPYTQPRP